MKFLITKSDAIQHIRKLFLLERNGYEVYKFIEFIFQLWAEICVNHSCLQQNDILKREFSGYLFINDIIAPISNELESAEITEAFNNTKSFTSWTK